MEKSRVRCLERDETALIDGPASIRILSGEGAVFGAIVTEGDELLVRNGKLMPLTAASNQLRFEAKVAGHLTVIKGNAIPTSWKSTADLAISSKGRALVLGDVDTGKTSFCTYMANRALLSLDSVGYVDGDIGQPEMGPPTTVTAINLKRQSYTLAKLRPLFMYFVGYISPSFCQETVVEAVKKCAVGLERKGAEIVIINTDGWIKEGGLHHKASLIDTVEPQTIPSLLSAEEDIVLNSKIGRPTRFLRLTRPKHIRPRTQEERRERRANGYRAYFRSAKRRRIELDKIALVNSPLHFRERPTKGGITRLEDETGLKVEYFEESSQALVAESHYPAQLEAKDFKVLRSGWEEGLLVGLMKEGTTIGLGILQRIDYKRRTLDLLCTLEADQEADRIELGRIRLDEVFREILCTF